MKMKTCFVWIAIIFIISIQMVFPQSISFIYPTEGQTVTNTSSGSETNITVNYAITGTMSSNNQNRTVTVKIYDQNWQLITGRVLDCDMSGNFAYSSSVSWVPGTYKLIATLQELLVAGGNHVSTGSTFVNFHVKHTISIVNSFGAGSINIDEASSPSGSQPYRYTSDVLNLGAIDQLYSGSNYTWNATSVSTSNWKRKTMNEGQNNITGATSRNLSYTVASNDNGATITADLRKTTNMSFQNYYVGVGYGGTIGINNTIVNSPSTNNICYEPNQISVESISYSYNGINYNFKNWTDNNNNIVSTNYIATFNPSSPNIIYTANYTGIPSLAIINMNFERIVNNPVKLNWTDNPNTNVTQYQIWRKVGSGSEQLLATIGRGVQTYIDYDYQYTGNSSNLLLYYDVRQYYSTEQTYSVPWYRSVYGKISVKTALGNNAANADLVSENITNYGLEQNSPNPFNPSTIISYQLPNDGFVSLKVYDMLGREVKTLVNDIKAKGKYSVSFDATNLASGIYFYQLKANGFSSIKKMILTK